MNAFASLEPAGKSAGTTSRATWIVSGLLAIVAAFDLCFWNLSNTPGLSLPVFFTVLALVVRLNRPRGHLGQRSSVLILLLVGTLAQSVVEIGFCNVLMLLTLTTAFSAETFFVRCAPGFDRWRAQMRAFFLAPFRFVQVGLHVLGGGLLRAGLSGRVAALTVIVLPTFALALLFGILLSGGNAVFALWTNDAFAWLWRLLPNLTVARVLLWLFVAIVAVAYVGPGDAPDRKSNWAAPFDRWPDSLPARLALASSALLLIALNAMFAVANGADAAFLWHGGILPVGVSYSQFVHQGVEMLIATVLLSALVLAWVFNQSTAVSGCRALKLLGALWIVQNLFLLLSTARRLELYIEAYDASVERVSTLIFLLLVTVGFALLGVMIGRGKVLAWPIRRSLLVGFATLYLVQFLNLAGGVADYNLAQWERDHSRNFDACYLSQLGPAAWPALVRAEKLGATREADEVAGKRKYVLRANAFEELSPGTRLDAVHWREFSLRAWWNRGALQEESDNK